MNQFDGCELPQACKECGIYDNDDQNKPETYLDEKTKLCEMCFSEKYEQEDE